MRPWPAIGLALFACTGGAAPDPASVPGFTDAEKVQLSRMRLTTALPPDPTNKWADHVKAAGLGRVLFYDKRLSPSGEFSCATCHDPEKHFTDGLVKGVAAGETDRHTPTIEGSQQGPWFFWDGRADSLWAQAMGPVESPVEMNSDRLYVATYVLKAYGHYYKALFRERPELPTRIEHARPDADPDHPLNQAWLSLTDAERHTVNTVFVNTMKMIAAFERTVIPGEAPFDRYVDALLAGDDTGAGELSLPAVRGLTFFLREGQCVSCHHGPFFTDRAFHNLGLPLSGAYDSGRTLGASQVAESPFNCSSAWSDADSCEELRFLNPTFDDFRSAFKTPTLRNVTKTAPYMHDGSMADLDAVLDFYSELPGEPVVGHRELTLQPLKLSSQQRHEIQAFLMSLEAPVREEAKPLARIK